MPHNTGPAPDARVSRPPSESPRVRRTFLIELGVGSVAIAGYFVPGCSPFIPDGATGNRPPTSTLLPRLGNDVLLGRDGDMATLRLPFAADSLLCAVNRLGADVIALLDGQHTVVRIARILAGRMGVPPTEVMQSQIALFVAQVGEMGFLQEPFYACIVETTES